MSTIHPPAPGANPGRRTRAKLPGRSPSRITCVSLALVLAALVGCADEAPTDIDSSLTRASSPEAVDDLSVEDATTSTLEVAWSQVTDARNDEAWYELRYAPSEADAGWDEMEVVDSGPCASPIEGQQKGEIVICTVDGLAAGTSYDFEVASFPRGDEADSPSAVLSNGATGTTVQKTGDTDQGADTTTTEGSDDSDISATALSHECADPDAAWIWCDDFDRDRIGAYFEHDDDAGDFVRAASVGVEGSTGMRVRFSDGEVSAGSLKMAFGRTPQSYFDPVDDGTKDYREIYWRFYVKNEADWTGGGGNKLSRATGFASSSSWAQSMIAHVWSGSYEDQYLVVDPASGTDEEGNLRTTAYNDFDNLRWLGENDGTDPLFADDRVGEWYCVEARVRLNDAGHSNGEFQLWIDGELDAARTGLNWVGDYDDYGINAVVLENYWNDGSPKAQERYIDNFVVSTEPIGCPDV